MPNYLSKPKDLLYGLLSYSCPQPTISGKSNIVLELVFHVALSVTSFLQVECSQTKLLLADSDAITSLPKDDFIG